MTALCGKEELDESEIGTLIDFAKDAGGIEYAYASMERLRDEAVAALTSVFSGDDDSVKAFVSIFDYIIHRDY